MTDERRSYGARARTWAIDEQAGLRSALRHSRLFSLAAIVIAVLEALALMLMMPLKTVRPIPVLVDRETGFVEVLQDDGRRTISADDALIRSLLAQYVIARESFDISQAATDYRKVALWSSGSARQDYLTLMPASNPKSPLKLYPRTTLVDTRIRSVAPLGKGEALVRFETTRHDQDGGGAVSANWAAVLSYRFVNTPMSVEDRLTNPLGFQVVRYRRDPESPPPSAPSDPARLPTAPLVQQQQVVQPATVAPAVIPFGMAPQALSARRP